MKSFFLWIIILKRSCLECLKLFWFGTHCILRSSNALNCFNKSHDYRMFFFYCIPLSPNALALLHYTISPNALALLHPTITECSCSTVYAKTKYTTITGRFALFNPTVTERSCFTAAHSRRMLLHYCSPRSLNLFALLQPTVTERYFSTAARGPQTVSSTASYDHRTVMLYCCLGSPKLLLS